jgi:hypothetical protein
MGGREAALNRGWGRPFLAPKNRLVPDRYRVLWCQGKQKELDDARFH